MTHRKTLTLAALSMLLVGAFAGCVGSTTEQQDPETGLGPTGDPVLNETAPKVETFKGSIQGVGACGGPSLNTPTATFMNDFSVPKNTTAARFELAYKAAAPTTTGMYYRVETTEGKLIKSAQGDKSPLVIDLVAKDLEGLGTIRFRAWACGAAVEQPFDLAVSFFETAMPSDYTAFKA